MRTRLFAAVSAAILMTPAITQATVIENVAMSYQSGASFAGTVSFTNDFSAITAVSGTLTGYQFGITGLYIPGATDAITTALLGMSNPPSGPNTWYLLDFPDPTRATNLVSLAYDYSSSGITLLSGDVGFVGVNNVDFFDPMVSGSVRSVPEPATLSLLGLGLVGVFAARRRRAA